MAGILFHISTQQQLGANDVADDAATHAPRPMKITLCPSKARLGLALCDVANLAPQSSPSGEFCWHPASPYSAGLWALVAPWGGLRHQDCRKVILRAPCPTWTAGRVRNRSPFFLKAYNRNSQALPNFLT
ncbi:hypothetical protein DQ04_12231000 [Trypanosoma grayi]|uniref:hypothetical protein n=1 Tax=Trypanosoma grayi TaxID=71804 RepID=UPI0004F4A5DB|nr:hypothetical protein DQ04_12231000 [Trypanosoma grayi]KEG06790.1 hypothetical protein DQ04_12231000 [Trypanosoma grayi]